MASLFESLFDLKSVVGELSVTNTNYWSFESENQTLKKKTNKQINRKRVSVNILNSSIQKVKLTLVVVANCEKYRSEAIPCIKKLYHKATVESV